MRNEPAHLNYTMCLENLTVIAEGLEGRNDASWRTTSRTPSYSTTHVELNDAELANIADAVRWAGRRKRKILERGFLNEQHKRMYGDVWESAGTYPTMARNTGIDTYRTPVEHYQETVGTTSAVSFR